MPPLVQGAGSDVLGKFRSWPNASAVLSVFADYLGLAMLTPSLPFYLSEKGLTDDEIPFWNGAITTAQFAAIVIGNVFWGRFCDRTSSWRALQMAMLGDTVFFALSAVAPFGLRGAPSAGVMLAVVRFFAGLFTPLVSAVLYIFDRVQSPKELARGVSLYAFATVSAYGAGGFLVGVLYEPIGWSWVNTISAIFAGGTFLYVTFCSCPPLMTGKKPKPEGLMRALRTADFATHAATAMVVGYQYNCNFFMQVIILKEHFNWNPRAVGYWFLSIPAIMLPINIFVLPRVLVKYGFHLPISVAGMISCALYVALAIWSSLLRTGDAGSVMWLLVLVSMQQPLISARS